MTVSVSIDPAIIVKMRKKAEEVCEQFSNRVGVYGHNKVEQQVSGWMGEYAVRVLYRQGGVQAHQNIKDKKAPDLTIPAYSTLQESFETRQEEVKSWKSGYSWNEYGGTCTEYHATEYARKERDRVWFCEIDREQNIVLVHGFATPAEILASDIRITSSGANHQVEVMHRVSEAMSWVEEDKDGWF